MKALLMRLLEALLRSPMPTTPLPSIKQVPLRGDLATDPLLVSMISMHEGRRPMPYQDSVGILTIGVGRNLEANGLSEDEIDYLLSNDLRKAEAEANKYPWYEGLNTPRQMVVIDMIFNLGPAGFAKFQRTQASIARGDYAVAAKEMLESKWARQVGNRATRLAKIMETGSL